MSLTIGLTVAGAAQAAPSAVSARTVLQMVAWVGEGERLPNGTQDLLQGFELRQTAARVNLIHDRWPQAQPRLKYWTGSLREYAPDLTVVRDVWLPLYSPSLLALDDLLPSAAFSEVVPSVLDRGRLGGKLYGVPWRLSSRALYCRADWLQAAALTPPRTLSELAAAARKLTQPGKVWGLGLPAAADGDGAEAFLGLLAACGGRPVDERGRLTLNTPAAERALRWWLDLAASGATPPEALSWTNQELQEAFLAGRVAMVFGDQDFAARLKRTPGRIPYVVTASPTEHGPANLIACDLVVALASTKHPRECADFLGFLAGAGAQRALWMMGGLPASPRHVAEARQYANLAPFLDRLESARGWPAEQRTAVLRILDEALWLGLSGRAEPAAALQEAVEGEKARGR